ncbi:hypothetical protein C0Z01_14160 [Photobacterium kishitanii]|uniref:hypothetical protein n=1 Tax=Photobacterium kishitanii TaxID=318456 RepID=UPI0007EF7428|nr:hypothetical protein [Photobacterium kishitanii]OBU24954.1 hypothetical protein AYY22_21005 [Photobacterium kishitanii]PSW68700.1 hypothetical protein C0Z01_14160 [Photobacterium kishitanii]
MIEFKLIDKNDENFINIWNESKYLCFDNYDETYIEKLLINGKASIYLITGKNVNLKMIARSENNEYVIMIMVGKGLSICGNQIKNKIFENGFKSIRYHTNKKGMTRLLKSIGFSINEWVMVCNG